MKPCCKYHPRITKLLGRASFPASYPLTEILARGHISRYLICRIPFIYVLKLLHITSMSNLCLSNDSHREREKYIGSHSLVPLSLVADSNILRGQLEHHASIGEQFADLVSVNISSALSMGLQKHPYLTRNQDDTGLTMFFIPNILFEIPSNAPMKTITHQV
jgi:hypothetical protein